MKNDHEVHGMTEPCARTGSVPHTTRRRLLGGAALVGAAAMAGGASQAAPARTPLPRLRLPDAGLVQAQADAIERAEPADLSGLERVRQRPVAPPNAPDHEQVASGPPKIVEVELVVRERQMVVDEDTGASIWALTYNGSVPGPLIVVHEGDYVELTLKNPANSMLEHNIDFHASTGALGGGALTHVYPGEETVLRWKATKPGCFTYHCAPGGAMIPYHVCHGMNGAVMVLPRTSFGRRFLSNHAVVSVQFRQLFVEIVIALDLAIHRGNMPADLCCNLAHSNLGVQHVFYRASFTQVKLFMRHLPFSLLSSKIGEISQPSLECAQH